MVDFSIPQVQVPNIAGLYQQGQEAGRQNALHAAMQQYGGAAAMGDQNALAAIAQFDPRAALDLMSGRQQMDLRERADNRSEREFGLSQKRTEQSIAESNQSMEIARQRAREATEAHKVDMTAAQREQAMQEIQLIGAFENVGDEAQWDALAAQLQLPELKGQFGQKDALIGMAQGVSEALADDDLTEYQRQSLDLERQRLEVGNRGSRGLNPIWVEEDGRTVLYQPTTSGPPIRMELPDGATPLPGIDRVDTGTQVVQTDRRSGDIVGAIDKDVSGEASAKAQGTAAGEIAGAAQAQLPQFAQAFGEVDSLISDILADPEAIKSITGASPTEGFGGVLPPLTQSDRDLTAKIESLGGRAFLSARQALKGGGAITDYEGQQAGRALLRAQRAQSAEEFSQALVEFREHLARGLSILQQQAQGNVSGAAPDAATATRRLRFNPETGELE